MNDDSPRRAFNKVTFEQVVYSRNTDMLEHMVLLSVLQSYRFYAAVKTRLCPVLPDKRSFRPDFTRADFNHIYSFAAQFWETLARVGIAKDMGINADLVDLIFAKKVEQNQMTGDDAHAILIWLREDLRTIEVEKDIMRTLPDNPMFLKWLEERVMDYEQRRLSQSLGRPATLRDMQESIKVVQKSIQPTTVNVISSREVLFSKIKYQPAVPTRMPKLNEMLGGGFRHAEANVVGAISGGGKTVLAMQWALDFILQDFKTVVLTTEQPPSELIYRMISNHLDLDFGIFTQRIDNAERRSQKISGVELDYLPGVCTDAEHWDAFNYLAYKAQENLLFIDWTGTEKTFEGDFDCEVEMLQATYPGWDPHVIIVDWVGGGVQLKGQDGDKLRHYYRAAGDTIVRHMKRTGRVGIMFAQLNKALVRPHQTFVTMDTLSECKTLVDRAAAFLGVTALRNVGTGDEDINFRLRPFQFICADKCRYGPGGKIKVTVEFNRQRFGVPPPHLRGGGA